MTENKKLSTGDLHHAGHQENNNTVVMRVPKPNMQIAVLGLIAVITVFQSVQLFRINSQVSSAPVKTVPAATSTSTGGSSSGTGSSADVPQSMVGGC